MSYDRTLVQHQLADQSQAGNVNNILSNLSKVVDSGRTVFTDIPTDSRTKPSFTKMVFGSSNAVPESLAELLQRASVRPLRPYLNELRCTKSDAEIACMKEAGEASGKTFTEAMSQGYATEKELDTFLDYGFKSLGCEESAYVPVVAGGAVSWSTRKSIGMLILSECTANTLCSKRCSAGVSISCLPPHRG